MGAAWSRFQWTAKCDLECGQPSPNIDAGAALAGIGTFWLFFLTVIFALTLSLINIIRQLIDNIRLRRSNGYDNTTKYRRVPRPNQAWQYEYDNNPHTAEDDAKRGNMITEAVLVNFSDQQLIAGLAMAGTLRWSYSCAMTAYHYDLACYMLLASITTHLTSLLAIDRYFYPFEKSSRATASNIALLALRCFGIACSIVLTGLVLFNRNQNTFPVEPTAGAQLLQPAACFFVGADAKDAAKGIDNSIAGFVGRNWSHGLVQYVLFIFCIITTVPLAIFHSFERGVTRRLSHPVYLILPRLVVVGGAIAIMAWTLSLAWGLRSWMLAQVDFGLSQENEWNFGQVLSLCLLILSPITLFDAASAKYDSQQEQSMYLTAGEAGRAAAGAYRLVS